MGVIEQDGIAIAYDDLGILPAVGHETDGFHMVDMIHLDADSARIRLDAGSDAGVEVSGDGPAGEPGPEFGNDVGPRFVGMAFVVF